MKCETSQTRSIRDDQRVPNNSDGCFVRNLVEIEGVALMVDGRRRWDGSRMVRSAGGVGRWRGDGFGRCNGWSVPGKLKL